MGSSRRSVRTRPGSKASSERLCHNTQIHIGRQHGTQSHHPRAQAHNLSNTSRAQAANLHKATQMLVALCGSYAWQKDGTPPQHCHRCQDLKQCPLRHCAGPRQKCLQAGRQHAALDTRLNGEQSSSQHPTILQGGHTTARPVSGVQDTRILVTLRAHIRCAPEGLGTSAGLWPQNTQSTQCTTLG